MEAAIHVNHLSGAVVELAVRDRANSICDIRGFAHSALGQQTLRNFFFISGNGRGDHVGSNDSRLYFENRNSITSQTGREQLDCHTEAGLGHAVVAAVHRSRETGD